MVLRRWRRSRRFRLRPVPTRTHLCRRIHGLSLALRRGHRPVPQHLGAALQRLGHRFGKTSVPLPVDRTRSAVAVQGRRPVSRRQRVVPDERPGPDLDCDQPRPDAQRQVEAAVVGRTDHRRQHRRRGLRHDFLDRRITGATRCHLGRQRRWPRARDAGRRRALVQRDAESPAGMGDGRRHRGVTQRCRHDVVRRASLPSRRSLSVSVRHPRFRQDLATTGQGPAERPAAVFGAGRSGRCALRLSRHRTRRLVLA